MSEQKLAIYEFNNFRLDAAERQLLRDGKPVTLPSKAFDLLLALVENNNRLVAKDELFSHVWHNQIVEESNLTVHISALRKALGETKNNPRFIETVPGYGYRFVGDMQNTDLSLTQSQTRTNGSSVAQFSNFQANEGQSIKSQRPTKTFFQSPRLWFFVGAVILVLLLAAGFGFWFYDSKQKNQNAGISFADARTRQLTTRGRVGWAALSPDGKFYSYSLNEPGEFVQSLWLKQTDGGNEIQVRPAAGIYRGMSFSSDGKTLYFTVSDAEQTTQNGFFRMPALGGVAEKLPIDVRGFFALSPDNNQIAFTRTKKDASALIVAKLDGTGEREIAARRLDAAFSSRLTWSPDAEQIAIFASADNTKEGREIFVVRVSSREIRQLTTLDWTQASNLVWRRDGQGLIIVATGKNESVRHLWHVDYPGGLAQRIANDTDSYGSALSFSVDGKSLLAVQLKQESNIWIAPAADLSAARQITFSSINGVFGWNGFDWTIDNRIVFTAGVDRSSALYSMETDGGNIRQITTSGFYDHKPNVTADGLTIIFQSNRSGANEIWRVGVDGSNLQQLTSGGRNTDPHLTPDGKAVIYVSNRAGKNLLQRISTEGGAAVQITDHSCSDPRLSPSGKEVACGHRADDQSPIQLALLKMENGAIAKLFNVPRSANFANGFRWTADGKTVCYRDWGNGIWQQPIDGGEPKRLAGLPAEKIYIYDWSPDGKLFAFTRGREISDAVLIRDFK